jgi:hypothetical protein
MWFVMTNNAYDPITVDCKEQVLFTWDKTVDKMGLWIDTQREQLGPRGCRGCQGCGGGLGGGAVRFAGRWGGQAAALRAWCSC